MNRLVILLLMLTGWIHESKAQFYQPVDSESSVRFYINNFGSQVEGSFRGLKGKISFDPLHPASTIMNVSVDAASVKTGIAMRDRHLKQEKYFHIDQYPHITITGSGIKPGKLPGTYIMAAAVTIKSATRTVEIPFKASRHAMGWLFEGRFTINRRHFDVGGGSISLSDPVTVELKVLAQQ